MADNLAVTPGSGALVVADEVTYSGDTAKLQGVELFTVSGAEGSRVASQVNSSNGIPVSGTLTVQDGIAVVGGGVNVTVTATIDTIAYTIGDAFGGTQASPRTGLWKITAALRVGASGYLSSIQFESLEDIKPTGYLWFFTELPTISINNNAQITSFNTSDNGKCIGPVPVVAGDWTSFGVSPNQAFARVQVGQFGVACTTGQDLYMLWQLTNAPDYVSATQVYGRFHFLQN